MPGRLLVAALVMLFLAGLVSAVWNLCDWPPPRLILKYGFPPTGGPTGRTMTIEGVEFVELKPGYFRMGSRFHCQEGDLLGRIGALLHQPWGRQPVETGTEVPLHWIELARGLWIARTEITNEQYERFDRRHDRGEWSTSDKHPVVFVAWEQANSYCTWLSEKAAALVRLPTEAEWEYACRAGSRSEYCFGGSEEDLAEYAWCAASHVRGPQLVGSRRSNTWELFDLHGNVWEWCRDAWHESYNGAPSDGSGWEVDASALRVARGGAWLFSADFCRSATRRREHLGGGTYDLGFRPCMVLPEHE